MNDWPESVKEYRHVKYSHKQPVLTCPVCIWILAGQFIMKRGKE